VSAPTVRTLPSQRTRGGAPFTEGSSTVTKVVAPLRA
jgi:hypothetical protein